MVLQRRARARRRETPPDGELPCPRAGWRRPLPSSAVPHTFHRTPTNAPGMDALVNKMLINLTNRATLV